MHKYANPRQFRKLFLLIQPYLIGLCVITAAIGFYFALYASPADYQQGQTVRIMYIHVPSAWLASGLYAGVGIASICYLIWRHPLADIAAHQTAKVGLIFTIITLATGSIWGKPMWGAWWVWDARLTSVFVLFLIYAGYCLMRQLAPISEKSSKSAAILALIGLANLPIIRFSVDWWNTLHQPASIIRSGGVSIHESMQIPLFMMMLATFLFAILIIFRKMLNHLDMIKAMKEN